jgi:RNA polymerase sigma-70 factor, ECF subfamily
VEGKKMVAEDKILIEQAKRDSAAFGRLYTQFVDRIFRYVYRLTQDEAAAEDLTAVTFEKALRHIQRYEWQGKSILAWLYRIARNETFNYQRKIKWLRAEQLNEQNRSRQTETAVLDHQQFQEIHLALTCLSTKDREIIHLRFFEALSSEDVAEVLNCSKNNVYLRLHRALKRLQTELSKTGFYEEVSYEV